MGQYYKIVNLDKRQYIEPHSFFDGSKLMEFGLSSCGMMSGLAILLADGNDRGGGDLHLPAEEGELKKLCESVIGSWKMNRIVVTGDYADPCEIPGTGITGKELRTHDGKDYPVNLYNIVDGNYNNPGEPWEDISLAVLTTLCADGYAASRIAEGMAGREEWDKNSIQETLNYMYRHIPSFRKEMGKARAKAKKEREERIRAAALTH